MEVFKNHIDSSVVRYTDVKWGEWVYSVKRIDELHHEFGGNKWYKLKYNLESAREKGCDTLLTFGGPWSNHIYAVSAAAQFFGFKSIGIIRGEEPETWSKTLEFALSKGMRLEFISRLAYAEKDTEDFKAWLFEEYGDHYYIPEGGSNFLGVNGCMEILEPNVDSVYTHICCPGGTGATLAGLLISKAKHQKVVGFSSLKGEGYLRSMVHQHLKYFLMDDDAALEIMEDFIEASAYHFGGYGKYTPELIEFICSYYERYAIPLDQVYTGKMIYGLHRMIEENAFKQEHRLLVIHTGGHPGRSSIPEFIF